MPRVRERKLLEMSGNGMLSRFLKLFLNNTLKKPLLQHT